LRFLLSARSDFLRETNLVGVRSDDLYLTVVIEEKQPLIGTSRLMMMLGAKDYQLKQWTVTDPQGYNTTWRSCSCSRWAGRAPTNGAGHGKVCCTTRIGRSEQRSFRSCSCGWFIV
jgi:hypothetical protein